MRHRPCQPIQCIKNFSGLLIFGGINNFCSIVVRFLRRDINHSFLRKAGPDDIPSQITKARLIRSVYSILDINMKTNERNNNTTFSQFVAGPNLLMGRFLNAYSTTAGSVFLSTLFLILDFLRFLSKRASSPFSSTADLYL